MGVEKIYSKAVEHLEEKISYGSLGVLDTLSRLANDSPNTKRNIMLVNVATMVRNVLNQKLPDNKVFAAVEFEASQYRLFFNNYALPKSHLIFYFQPDVYELIPETSRRKMTDTREDVLRYANEVMMREGVKLNHLTNLGSADNVTYYGLYTTKHFIYNELVRVIKQTIGIVPKVWLVSHCPLDYFIFETLPVVTLIDSHTGKLTGKSSLGVKVFKDPDTPFTRMTLKLLGDKEYVAPLVRKNVIAKLGKLRLKTEKELDLLARTTLGVDPKALAWRI